ncbi:MAG: hypothetical protein QXX17_01680 [Conexivisphaerales archaeon]
MSSTIIHIKLKRGSWEIDLDCPEDRVTEIIQKVLAGLESSGAIQKQESEQRGTTCKNLL